MKTLTLENWQQSLKGLQVGATLGNFDGVHVGHQALLNSFLEDCKNKNLEPVLFTFKPHPELYFHPDKSHLLTDYSKKYELLQKLGFNNIVEVCFENVRSMTGQEFADDYLFSHPGLKLLWLGYDFTFGCDKADPAQIHHENIEVKKFPAFNFEGHLVSSSLIREKLRSGDLALSNKLLSRSFEISGIVGHGKKLGREIGFPTVNLEISKNTFTPAFGVYGVICDVEGKEYVAAMNVGVNPSVESNQNIKWEAHLLDFEGDLYHKQIHVRFVEFIRPEKKFDSIENLKQQIQTDISQVRKSFGS